MKKITKILALVLVLSMVCVIFASCGATLSGTYAKDGVFVDESYTFSGNKVTYKVATGEIEGTYEISEKDGAQVITFDFPDGSLFDLGDGVALPFEKTDDGIKIAGTEYKKQ